MVPRPVHTNHATVQRALQAAGVQPTVAAELGVTMLPRSVAERLAADSNLRLVRVTDPIEVHLSSAPRVCRCHAPPSASEMCCARWWRSRCRTPRSTSPSDATALRWAWRDGEVIASDFDLSELDGYLARRVGVDLARRL